jgi:hypothetical protein
MVQGLDEDHYSVHKEAVAVSVKKTKKRRMSRFVRRLGCCQSDFEIPHEDN